MLGRFNILSLFNACHDTYQLQPIKFWSSQREKDELIDENPTLKKGLEYITNKKNPTAQFMLWEREEENIICEMKDTINFDKTGPTESGE